MRRFVAGVLVVVAVALGGVACGEDDSGVVESPGTTVGSGGPGTTRGLDYPR